VVVTVVPHVKQSVPGLAEPLMFLSILGVALLAHRRRA
jgi:hypothetical protein